MDSISGFGFGIRTLFGRKTSSRVEANPLSWIIGKAMDKDKVATSILAAKEDLESALHELEKLPAINSSSVAFAAHALNNFLAVSSGTVELLGLYFEDHPDSQLTLALDTLRHSTDLMAHIVSQLMATSVTTEVKLKIERVDLSLLVKRLCFLFQRKAHPKNISILFSSAGDPFAVNTDRVALAAVLDNLLSNAVKYSDRGKKIWVQVINEPTGVVCSVRDEGPGISPENQARLFQHGAKLGSVPTGGEPSTGYGLAVAKEIIDRLGGKIWCESELGKGASFAFSLPVDFKGNVVQAI
jgi:signal transduction histidine kinase